MRRELFIHFAFWFAAFTLISVFRGYLSLAYWPFWVGGVAGTLIIDVDHLIYVFFLNPQELTSQRVNFLFKKREIGRVLTLLYETRRERKNLIFHTFVFEIVFFIFGFLMITSSSSFFVRGIILAMLLHLMVDQLSDFLEMKNLSNWGKISSKDFSYKETVLFLSVSSLALILLAFLM